MKRVVITEQQAHDLIVAADRLDYAATLQQTNNPLRWKTLAQSLRDLADSYCFASRLEERPPTAEAPTWRTEESCLQLEVEE